MSMPNPPRRTLRRRHPYAEQRFWETCVHVALQSESALAAIYKADVALVAWKERYGDRAPVDETPEVERPESDD